MTNIEMQTMNAVCAIPRVLREISDKLDRLIIAIEKDDNKKKDQK